MHKHARISQLWQHLVPEKPAGQRLYRLMPGVLILMLLVGAAFQPAHAGNHSQIDDPEWTSPRYTLNAQFDHKPDTICPGDKLVILTYLYVWNIPPSQRAQHAGANVLGYNRAGVEVMGRGESYGTLSPRTAVTHQIKTSLTMGTVAPFLYTAGKPGTETLTFDAGPPAPAGTEAILQFNVEKCERAVAMIYRGVLAFPPGRNTYSGLLEPIELVADEEGQYSTAALFQLAEGSYMPGTGCSVAASIAGSQTDIVATSTDQMLDITLTFHPTTNTLNMNCPGGNISATGFWGADNLGPVIVSIPASGGIARFTETHTGYWGEYTVIVERVPDDSVAASPGTVLLASRP